ncbi:type IV secretion system protein [Novosphingopyxis sp.]|uniref:type IV secretion system protein n=1 Tax=Novosphingopyxis sp. TaxID=2709690 RepID=UPI003B5CC624
MPCGAVTTGQGFLSRSIEHIDCQAATIGSYGFQSLAAPGSAFSIAVTSLLTLFIAILGIRLILGDRLGLSDVVVAALEIGVVLTLLGSWPAYRTLFYDVVLEAPADISAALLSGTGTASTESMVARLQGVDDAILALTRIGSGRFTAGAVPVQQGQRPDEAFQEIAVSDDLGWGTARLSFLAGTLVPLIMLRIAAGLLLALGPLFAGLLLFEATRSLFLGWLSALFGIMLASTGFAVLLSVELAVLEPWLTSALRQRASDIATPSAPTELLALTLAFSLASLLLLAFLTRFAVRQWVARASSPSETAGKDRSRSPASARPQPTGLPALAGSQRAQRIAEGIESIQRAEWVGASIGGGRGAYQARPLALPAADRGASDDKMMATAVPLGQSYKRTMRRSTRAGNARDRGP